MSFQRVHQSRSQNPQTQTSSSTSQFAHRPFPVQEPKRTPTQEELENQAFQQNKFEATGLQLKEKYGTITHVEQERLGVLQAKVNDFWAQRLERASRFGHNLANVPVHAPGEQVSAPIQPQFATRLSRASVSPLLQAKLSIGQVNDKFEQEADRIAEQVLSMAPPTTPNIQQQTKAEQEEIQTKLLVEAITPIVQRQEVLEEDESIQAKCESCEEEEQVQRSPSGVPQVQTDLEDRLNASKGGGSPLPDEVRSFMEPRFKSDFSQVRVHTDNKSVQMNRDLNAQAFTHKKDIYYGAGKSPSNNVLTAHELTHTVQQSGFETYIQRQHRVDLEEPFIIESEPSLPEGATVLDPIQIVGSPTRRGRRAARLEEQNLQNQSDQAMSRLMLLGRIYLNDWQDAARDGVLAARQPDDPVAQENYHRALAGNMVWAATSLFPATSVARIAWTVRAMSFGGAAAGSGALASSSSPSGVELIRQRLRVIRDTMEGELWSRVIDTVTAAMAAREFTHSLQDERLWYRLFPEFNYETRTQEIAEHTKNSVEASLDDFMEQWMEYRAQVDTCAPSRSSDLSPGGLVGLSPRQRCQLLVGEFRPTLSFGTD
jgi:hypothetical protein